MTGVTIPNSVLQWQFAGKSGNIRSQNQYSNNTGYNMFCRANNQYLTWGKVPLGLNMIYTSDPAVKKTHFKPRHGSQVNSSFALTGIV
jgi:hypothetical protein